MIEVYLYLYLFFADSLEVGNNKKALQEADKVLKKNPAIQCARALKALALLRIGRDEDAQLIISQIANEKPFDDPTLQVMSFCYKEQEQCKCISSPYWYLFVIEFSCKNLPISKPYSISSTKFVWLI